MTAALDALTRAYVIKAVMEDLPVKPHRDTGAIIPPHLDGVLFSIRDLHASKFAEIDARMDKADLARKAALEAALIQRVA